MAWISVLAAGIFLFIFRQQILWQMGQTLVNAGPPLKAEIVVALGGDSKGHRILEAAQLVREGYAPKVLVSGAFGYWGHYESEYAVAFAVERGYSRADFIASTYPADSTLDEAENDADQLRKMGIHRFLLVTDPWHTARAVRIFHRVAPDLEVHAVPCADRRWANGVWWRTREGRKVWALEALKTAANLLGI